MPTLPPLPHALQAWRAAARHALDGDDTACAVVVEVALASLQRYCTLDALLAAARADPPDPWLMRLCRLPDGRALDPRLVHAAACWRRAQQLIALAVEDDGAPGHPATPS